MLNSFQEAFGKGKLSISQRRGVISLIPKDENYLVVLTNCRPITLLNVDYKILARLIAKRIEPKLPTLIHTDQTGFVKGRFIGQNVRLLNDIMEYTEMNKIPGIMVFVDFEKAFDLLEWHFIQNTLRLFNFEPNIRQWISTLYCAVESGVLNGGYMTNYFKVSRGVRQGCPLSPLLFILAVEILAQKIRQNPNIQGIVLPGSVEAKLSQFADDTILICKDVNSLRENISVLNEFGKNSGLKLNKKKTKAMWIGSLKENKTCPIAISTTKDPIKILGTFVSYNSDKNDYQNFFIKIQKMETKLNIWLSRDLTLMGRTLLAKSLGVSKLVYAASMLTVPEEVINIVQRKLFSFLWKNKNDKIKRTVLYQAQSKGGLNFPNFRTTVKSLRLSWISRFLSGSNDAWKAIPNTFFNRYGGLSFLLKCNYNTKKLNRNIPLFYIELLDFFKELKSLYNDCYSSILLLWNNENITIEGKSLYWKKLADKGVLFVQDLLNNNGNYVTYEDFKQKYGIDINFIYYFQLLAAIPSSLKTEGASTARPLDSYLNDPNVFQLSEGKNISLSKMRCKDYYLSFRSNLKDEPTSVKTWARYYPPFANKWEEFFKDVYCLSRDNKLKQFSFKLLHRILVTNKELKKYKIKTDDKCFFRKLPDSLEHTFLECSVMNDFSNYAILPFNEDNKIHLNLSKYQFLFNDFTLPSNLRSLLKRKFNILVVLAKKYVYFCKMTEKIPSQSEFQEKLKLQWKIEKCEN